MPAAEMTAPGGRLVYAVCSLEPEEGSDQIAAFLRGRSKLRAPADFAGRSLRCRFRIARRGLKDAPVRLAGAWRHGRFLRRRPYAHCLNPPMFATISGITVLEDPIAGSWIAVCR